MSILKVNNICRHTRRQILFTDISFEVFKGDCYAIIGKDNEGKTSIINSILGIDKIDSGEIVWFDNPKFSQNIFDFVSYVPDELLCFHHMNGIQFLDMSMKLDNLYESADRAKKFLEYFEIDPFNLLEDMPFEENKCIYFISAILKNPKVLILDEPYIFLNQKATRKLNNLIKKYTKLGNTVIITSDNFNDILPVCNRFSAIQNRTIIKTNEKLNNYSSAKKICISGLNEDDFTLLSSYKNIIARKFNNSTNTLIYNGDAQELNSMLSTINFTDINILDITIDDQIFDITHRNGD